MTTLTSIMAAAVGIGAALTVSVIKMTAYCLLVPVVAALSVVGTAYMVRYASEGLFV
jgi:hypothetical protein